MGRRSSALTLAALLSVPGAPSAAPSCFGKRATIVGTPGRDHLGGTDGDDVIYLGGGDDVADAHEGNDRLCGGDGDDELHGGDGSDHTDGGDGRRLRRRPPRARRHDRRRPGADEIIGGSVIKGGSGDDNLDSYSYLREVGVDEVSGGPGDDVISGRQQEP